MTTRQPQKREKMELLVSYCAEYLDGNLKVSYELLFRQMLRAVEPQIFRKVQITPGMHFALRETLMLI